MLPPSFFLSAAPPLSPPPCSRSPSAHTPVRPTATSVSDRSSIVPVPSSPSPQVSPSLAFFLFWPPAFFLCPHRSYLPSPASGAFFLSCHDQSRGLPYPPSESPRSPAFILCPDHCPSPNPRTPCPQPSLRHSTPGDSPMSGITRRLPAPNGNSNTSLTSREAVTESSHTPTLNQPTPHVCTIRHLLNTLDIEPTPPPAMYRSKASIWGSLPNHGFRAHTVTLALR